MTSHHITCHVTMSCATSSSKRKRKENQYKIRKIKEKKNKIVSVQAFHNIEENDLFVKPEKCVWKVKEVEFLGVIIREDRVRIEKEKVQGVIEWPALRSVKNVQKFLRLANYYRQFVKDFAKIAKPLHEIMRKETI